MSFLAVVLVCGVTTAAPDCSRDTALDMSVQPVEQITACLQTGQIVATHMSLQPGEYHKVVCERRRNV